MWGTALGLVTQPLAERMRHLVRRGMLMAAAVALASLAFLVALGAIFAVLEPQLGAGAAAGILAGGLAFLSLLFALFASRPTQRNRPAVRSGAGHELAGREQVYSWQLLAAAFAAGMAAGRKW